MDVIRFELNKYKYEYSKGMSNVVDIYINDILFINLNKRFHIHAPLSPGELYYNLYEYYKETSVCIYGCLCGESGCDPILVNVDVGKKIVTWYDLEFDKCGEEDDLSGKYGRFVFDKRQYFKELKKLRDWVTDGSLNITFEGIECGYLTLNICKGNKFYPVVFDELLSDPIPALVRIRNRIRKVKYHTEEVFEDSEKILGIKVSFYDDEYVYIEIDLNKDKRTIIDILEINVLIKMIDSILTDLLSDKGFPYVYPCYHLLDDNEEYWRCLDDKITEMKLSGVDNETITTELLGQGIIPLTDEGEKQALLYRSMLDECLN